MPAKDLGSKHTCWKCGTRFYDLKKPVPLCPKCGSDARASPQTRSPAPAEKKRAPPREEPAEEVDAVEDAEVEKEEEGVEDEAEERDDE